MQTEARYLIIADKIKRKIYSNIYKKNQALPSEKELCSEYNVSRETVKKSIRYLVEEGYLYTVPGKGSFVFDRVQFEYAANVSITSFFKNGFTDAELVFANIVKPDIYDVYNMRISPDENIISLHWLIKNSGKIIALNVRNILYTTGVSFDEANLEYTTLSEAIPDELCSGVLSQKTSFNCVIPPDEVKKSLKIDKNKVREVVKVQMCLSDMDGEICGWDCIYIMPDEFIFNGESV